MLVALSVLYILIASATTLIDYEFSNNTLLAKPVERAINRRNADLNSQLIEVKGDISCTNMRTVFLQKVENNSALLGFIF